MATLQHHQIHIGCGCAKPKGNCICFSPDLPPPPEKKPKLTSHGDEDDPFSDDAFSDDSSDDYDDGFRRMTKKESRKYSKQVEESDGFDVDDFPHVFMYGRITPLTPISQKKINSLTDFANLALLEYNTTKGTNWEFAKFIKANGQVTCGFNYYITFEVKPKGASDDDTSAQIFQAWVSDGFPTFEVQLCRPKPN